MSEDYEENAWDFISRIGTPFAVDAYVVCSKTAQYFTLGGNDETGTNYDLNGDGTDETAPFKNKEMWLTSMELYAPTAGSCSVGICTFDNTQILAGAIAGGASLMLAGYGTPGSGASINQGPTLSQRYNGKPLPVRRRIGIMAPSTDQIANTGAYVRLKLWGYYTDRKF